MPRDYNCLPVTYWDTLEDAHLGPMEKLVETYLTTCSSSTSIGLLIQHPSTIAYYTGLSPEEVQDALTNLVFHDRIQLFPGDWIFIINRWELEPAKNSPQFLEGAHRILVKCPKACQVAFNMRQPEFLRNVAERNEIPYRDTEPEPIPKPPTKSNMLRDPDVPDSEAVGAGCEDLPDPKPYTETQLRQVEKGHEPTPKHHRGEQGP